MWGKFEKLCEVTVKCQRGQHAALRAVAQRHLTVEEPRRPSLTNASQTRCAHVRFHGSGKDIGRKCAAAQNKNTTAGIRHLQDRFLSHRLSA